MREKDFIEILAEVKDSLNDQAYPEAVRLCKDTLMELEDAGQSEENARKKTQLLFCLSEICHVSGRWMDGLMYLSTVISKSSELADPDIKSEAVIRIADIRSKMGNWNKALEKYDEGEKLVKRFENPYLLGRTYVGRGTVFWRRGKYEEAMSYADKTLKLGESIDNQHLVGSAFGLKASISFDMREYQDAIDWNDRALEAFRTLGDDIEIARILNNKGEVYKITGDYTAAIQTFQEGLIVLTNSTNNRSLGYIYTNLTECQIRKGNIVAAQKTYTLAENMVSVSEDKYIKAQLAMVKGLIEHSVGNISGALKELSKAQSIMKKLDIPYDMGVIHLEHARILKDTDRSHAFREYKNAILSFKKAHTQDMLKVAETELGTLGS